MQLAGLASELMDLRKALGQLQFDSAIRLLQEKGLLKPTGWQVGSQLYLFLKLTDTGQKAFDYTILVGTTGSLEDVVRPDPHRVFVVHGRNQAVRSAVLAFLRSIGLQPIEWSEAVGLTGEAAPFVGQVVEAGFSKAQAVVVILTGDDLVQLRPDLLEDGDPIYEREPTPQARPNVLFEAGYAFAMHPRRTIILEFGRLRPFTDVQGRYVIRMNNTGEKRQELANRLEAAGSLVSLRGTDWHTAGDFSGLA